MALTTTLSNEAASAELNAFTTLLDGGRLDIYDGAQPATCDTPPTTQALLVSLTLASPAYQSAVNGVADLVASISGVCASSGDAAWYRLRKSDGSPMQDGSVGTSGCNINLTSTAMVAGATLVIDSLVQTQRKS